MDAYRVANARWSELYRRFVEEDDSPEGREFSFLTRHARKFEGYINRTGILYGPKYSPEDERRARQQEANMPEYERRKVEADRG